MASAWGDSLGVSWGSAWGSVTAAVSDGLDIANSTTTTSVPSNYEICARSGFRVKPGTLVQQWDGYWVRPEDLDRRHPQDFVRSRGSESRKGPVSPEQDDNFISTAITVDDL